MNTRFRAYRLNTCGSSFSYFNGKKSFILGEARLNNENKSKIDEELAICGIEEITILYITSWDIDHCNYNQLQQIIRHYSPKKIEAPKYEPHTKNGISCKALIAKYPNRLNNKQVIVTNQQMFKIGFPKGINISYKEQERKKSNDNSSITRLRNGNFSVFTLGDIENKKIAKRLVDEHIEPIDVLILPHHGANNGFVTVEFLQKINPKIIVCCVNEGNRYNHPSYIVLDIIKELKIPIFTTQKNDILVTKNDNEAIKISLL